MADEKGAVARPDEELYLSKELECALQQTLTRIEERVQEVRGLLDKGASCDHLLKQLAEIRTLLDQAIFDLLNGHIKVCVATYVATGNVQALERLTKALTMVVTKA